MFRLGIFASFPLFVPLRQPPALPAGRPQAFCARAGEAAFSLVEVTLAMGIISFGVLAVMALMPVGLSTMQSAMDQTTETQIIRRLGGEILLTPFSEIPNTYQNKRIYFDEEGQPGDATTGRYLAVTSVVPVSYPGAGDVTLAKPIHDSLVTVKVELITPAHGGAGAATNVYSLCIPTSGE